MLLQTLLSNFIDLFHDPFIHIVLEFHIYVIFLVEVVGTIR